MTVEAKIIECNISEDGCLWSALQLTDEGENKTKIILYRVGLMYSGKPLRSRYVHEVADIHSPDEIPAWRQIDLKRDYGFSPKVFRELMKKLGQGK